MMMKNKRATPHHASSWRHWPAAVCRLPVATWLLFCLAALFVITGAVTLGVAAPTPALTVWHLSALAGSWTVIWGLGLGLLHTRLRQSDELLIPLVALLTGWGLLLLARVAPGFLLRQLLWLALGVGALCAVALTPRLARWLRRYRYTLLVGGLLLLAITIVFGVNPSGYGARLWLGLPLGHHGIYFQPSELLKLLLVSYLAAYLAERRAVPVQEEGRQLWLAVLGPLLLMVGLSLVLLAWQEDLGAALLFYLTFLAMLYLAWGKFGHVLAGLLCFAPLAVGGALLSSRVALRVSIWRDPWAPAQADRAYQILRSLFALAAGGLLGEGPGLGYPTLIPAVHTDFVYAALVEEYGTLGAVALLALLALLIQRGLHIAQGSNNPFEALLAGGLTALIGIQSWVIIAGNIKLIPITGVTLPFLSYGGSSLLVMLTTVGLLLNLSAPHPPPLTLTLTHATPPPTLRRTTSRLGNVLFLLLLSTALGTGVWSVIRTPELQAQASNPYRVLDELRIQRGEIVDRHGTLLANITVDEDGFVERRYPVPAAAPVVGYATLDYGTAGIEHSCDTALRGLAQRSPWQRAADDLLHRFPAGLTVPLTLDASLQRAAQELLDGQLGGAVLADIHTGDILALASTPTYNPATVAEQGETLREAPTAPLLNRVTQGLAQPGGILETVLLGALLEEGRLSTPPLPLEAELAIDGVTWGCLTAPTGNDWAAALRAACPAPFATVGKREGAAWLETVFTRWGLATPPPLELPTVAAEREITATIPSAEASGQGTLLVTPLQLLNVVATVGNDGERPPLHLLATPIDGCPTVPTATTTVLSPSTATALRALWPEWNADQIGHLAHALGGPERELLWYIGLDQEQSPRYAVVVLLENPTTPTESALIGQQLLKLTSQPTNSFTK
ncbi:MAG: FtsW/RodA/SpoVE family cell cycle protein [Chloroflexota bacterium]|nr:FtsW/RodA/SpoVE family cell cycle protein [Chloroflexota bacterium]